MTGIWSTTDAWNLNRSDCLQYLQNGADLRGGCLQLSKLSPPTISEPKNCHTAGWPSPQSIITAPNEPMRSLASKAASVETTTAAYPQELLVLGIASQRKRSTNCNSAISKGTRVPGRAPVQQPFERHCECRYSALQLPNAN